MRCFTFWALTCGLALGPVTANLRAAPVAAEQPDTVVRQRFNIAPQALSSALEVFSEQSGVVVEIAAPVNASLTTRGLRGSFTLPEAMRQLLAGHGLKARFAKTNRVQIVRDDGDDAPVYNLRPIEVVGTRNRGYATVRTAAATRTDTPLRDTPQSISVVTRDVIADQSMQSMADVVRYIPGVSMGQGEGHRDAPTIRGNSSTADFFVDGVRDDAQYFRDLYNVERVEALKGSNAMIFGRGGGGGVINRVSKEPQWAPGRVISVSGGSHQHRRATADLAQPLSDVFAARFNGMYENSRSFRHEASLERHAVNPTVLIALGESTSFNAAYEYFGENRTVDRGIPSFNGRPSLTARNTFFGIADSSYAHAYVHTAGTLLEHKTGALTIRNRSRFTDYDKFYQNSYASSAVNPAGTQVTLGAYNNATLRRNMFNQTDVIAQARTGSLQHTLLAGAEFGRQRSNNFRETGYYNNTATSLIVDFTQPAIAAPITFRQSATDADNRAVVTIGAAYVQDQLTISRYLQAILGLRYDRFNVDFHNNRDHSDLSRTDELVSPRAGLILKPFESASLYGSYSVSHLPSSGDQFSSLNATTQTLEPEQFTNYEIGAKWDVGPNLAVTIAAYRLDRSNTSAPDPLDAHKVVQTGSQRTKGIEANLAGDITSSWHVVAGAAIQDAEIMSTTTAARAGSKVALVPEKTFSFWNRYNVRAGLGIGAGIIRQSDMFAAVDNTVTLPGFTRIDGALFVRVTPLVSAQLNVENVLDTKYFATSHGNNNIMPGSGRSLRLTLTTRR